jgi:hypothetical protein
MISTVIALPYELARKPFLLVDSTLTDALPETSGPRLAMDRALGSADKIAGALLRNHDIAQRGVDRIERSAKLATAARLEEEAATRRQEARATAAAGRREAVQKRKAAADRAATGLREADAAEERGKQEAKARARDTAAAKKAAADRRAADRTETVQQRKKRVAAEAEAQKASARRQATSELDDAREAKESAADARADASRLSDLAEAKKQARKKD